MCYFKDLCCTHDKLNVLSKFIESLVSLSFFNNQEMCKSRRVMMSLLMNVVFTTFSDFDLGNKFVF